jgi:DNA-binding MarR family transcriptional regulator
MPARRATASVVDDTASWRPDPDTSTSILFDVFVLGQRTRSLVAEAMRDAGLAPDAYAAYSVVFEMGPITLTDLAAQLGMPVTTTADAVRLMTDRRHVRRTPHPTDGRAVLLSLTPAGLRAHRRASRSFEGAYRALVAELGEVDEAAARELLQALARSAERALATLETRGAARAG